MKRFLLILFFVLTFCFSASAEARKLALLVGVDDYAYIPPLKCCVNDMKSLKTALINIGFQESDIYLLTTGSQVRDLPTKEIIEQKVAEILDQAQPEDIVFFAFSGHGARDGETDYFCPTYAKRDNIEGTCVSISKVIDDLSKCKASFKWMIVDACRNYNTRDAKGFQVIPSPPAGIALFQSCDKGEFSYEENRVGGNGYFTKNLVAALSGEADANQDGKLTLLEVCSWTSTQTQEEVYKMENKTQRPFINYAATNFTLYENTVVIDARRLVEEARKAVKEESYDLALQKYDDAIAKCPQFESWKQERESVKRIIDTKYQMHITVPNDFITIEEAYKNVKDNGVITILPGKFELSGPLTINRPVTFRGSTGKPEDVVISCSSSHVFKITGNSPSFQNLTVSSGAESCGGFCITGGEPKLFHCIITSRKGSGIYVDGEDSNPQVDSCQVKKCSKAGILVYNKGRGSFSDCQIFENSLAGIQVYDSGNPTVTGCSLYKGKAQGALIFNKGLGSFTDCNIYNNAQAGIEVRGGGDPTVSASRINNGNSYGVYVHEEGLGKFNDCEISINTTAEIEVSNSGNPTVARCKIHDGKGVGVNIHSNGMGTFDNNTLEKNGQNDQSVNWKISSDAGEVKGSGNNPPIQRQPQPDPDPTPQPNLGHEDQPQPQPGHEEQPQPQPDSGHEDQPQPDPAPIVKRVKVVVPDNYPTIAEAYANVEDGGIITIKPGKYVFTETLVVNRTVTFRGSTGKPEDVVINCPSSDAFEITDGSASFQNLTAGSETEKCGGFYVTSGSPKLFHCVITSLKGYGMYVKGKKANPQVESCTFRNCATGVFVDDSGLGSFIECDIYDYDKGIVILLSGNPIFTRCNIHDGKEIGIFVRDNSLGSFTDCNIYANASSQILVANSGNPTFSGCKIYNGKDYGITVVESGLGSFTDCEIYKNAKAGIGIATSGNPTVTNCKIYDGSGDGIEVGQDGMGTFNNNKFSNNALKDLNVKPNAGNVKGSDIPVDNQNLIDPL